jgi:integrase
MTFDQNHQHWHSWRRRRDSITSASIIYVPSFINVQTLKGVIHTPPYLVMMIRSNRADVAIRHSQPSIDSETFRHRATINSMSEEKKQKLHQYELASLAPSSLRSYKSDYKQFTTWLAKHYPACDAPARATWPMCIDWLHTQAEQGLSKATIQRRWAFLRSHLCVSLKQPAVQQEYSNVIKGLLKSIEEKRERGKAPLMGPDVIRILERIPGETFDECQQQMFLLFAFGSALRRSEIAGLKWKDVTFLPKGVSVHMKKTQDRRKDREHQQEARCVRLC